MKQLLHRTMPQMIAEAAQTYGDRDAVCFKEETWTYRQLDELTDILAAGLIAKGVNAGDRVALLVENSARYVFSLYAIMKTGAIACLVNTGLKSEELRAIFEESHICHMIMGHHVKENYFYENYRNMKEPYPLKNIFDAAEQPVSPYCSWEEWIQEGIRAKKGELELRKEQIKPGDPCTIIYTSGTTGTLPKAVLNSHFHMVNGGKMKACGQGLTKNDVVCCALQMFHIFCIDVDILAALASGACLAVPDDYHTIDMLRTIERKHCTTLSAVPRIFQVMMEREDFETFDLSSLRTGIVGGAYCSETLFRKIDQAFDFTLLPGLGQTEITAGVSLGSLSDPLEKRSTTVGKFVPFVEGAIFDVQTGMMAELGETGEICVRSELVMMGYDKHQDLTRQAIDEQGWLHTGDLGWLDAEGYLHLNGKLKDVINRGGEKVLPNEIEAVISGMTGVEECVVFGVPDADYGEEVCACIVKKNGYDLESAEVCQYVKERLARYKIPRKIYFCEELPKTSTGKIRKRLLKERYSICERR